MAHGGLRGGGVAGREGAGNVVDRGGNAEEEGRRD